MFPVSCLAAAAERPKLQSDISQIAEGTQPSPAKPSLAENAAETPMPSVSQANTEYRQCASYVVAMFALSA